MPQEGGDGPQGQELRKVEECHWEPGSSGPGMHALTYLELCHPGR